MQPSLVLQKISRGETVIPAKAGDADPAWVGMIATSGLDAVRICLAHRSMDPSRVYGLIQACRLGGADTLIRVKPSTDYHRGPTRSLATGIHRTGISAGSSLGKLTRSK